MPAFKSPHFAIEQAMKMQQAGRFAEAAAEYSRLLAEWPELPDCWYNLGVSQRMTGAYEQALSSYSEALRRGVRHPEEVHLNRATIFMDHLRRDDDAQRELNAALMINPRWTPALLNLANLHEDYGRRDDARDVYEKIVEIDPTCYEALARLVGVTTISSPDDPLIAKLSRAASGSAASAFDKAGLGFALGDALDRCGRYDEAFHAYTAAHRAARASSNAPAYIRGRQEKLVSDIIDAFPAIKQRGTDDYAPIFICGMFRSGSTLCEQVLSAHPRVTAGGEIDAIARLIGSELHFPTSMAGINEATLLRLASAYRENLAALFPGADQVTNKRLDNFLYLGLIKQIFPAARIIHTTRNPLDTCLSIFFVQFDRTVEYATDLTDIGHYYRQYRRLMSHWQSLFGDDILEFDYDKFVLEPQPAAERLLAFCGLEWDDRCLKFYEARGPVKTASVWQVRRPLYKRSMGRWRNYEKHLKPLLGALSLP